MLPISTAEHCPIIFLVVASRTSVVFQQAFLESVHLQHFTLACARARESCPCLWPARFKAWPLFITIETVMQSHTVQKLHRSAHIAQVRFVVQCPADFCHGIDDLCGVAVLSSHRCELRRLICIMTYFVIHFAQSPLWRRLSMLLTACKVCIGGKCRSLLSRGNCDSVSLPRVTDFVASD